MNAKEVAWGFFFYPPCFVARMWMVWMFLTSFLGCKWENKWSCHICSRILFSFVFENIFQNKLECFLSVKLDRKCMRLRRMLNWRKINFFFFFISLIFLIHIPEALTCPIFHNVQFIPQSDFSIYCYSFVYLLKQRFQLGIGCNSVIRDYSIDIHQTNSQTSRLPININL